MRLLILACSKRKVSNRKKLPALQRYDGGAYRVIKKLQREQSFPPDVQIKIISARFGLIDSEAEIPYYELRMNRDLASKLGKQAATELNKYFNQQKYTEIYVDAGGYYQASLSNFLEGYDCPVTLAKGRIGERLHALRNWLIRKKTL
jgi:hypothetical protein